MFFLKLYLSARLSAISSKTLDINQFFFLSSKGKLIGNMVKGFQQSVALKTRCI